MQIAVLGAGSWGTTFASVLAVRNPTLLWSRSPALAREITDQHTNTRYLDGLALPESLRATALLEEAVGCADVLVVGIPTHGFRDILTQATELVEHIAEHDWRGLADQLRVTVSAGLARGASADVDELVQRADSHLYRAKSSGRARLSYDRGVSG